jgi:hypothetical protein
MDAALLYPSWRGRFEHEARHLGRRTFGGMFERQTSARGQERRRRSHGVVDPGRGIGRVEDDEVERPAEPRARQIAGRRASHDDTAFREAAVGGVGGDERDAARVVFEARGARRATAQRLEGDGARAGADIEQAGAVDLGAEHVEQRFAQSIGGGPHALPGG